MKNFVYPNEGLKTTYRETDPLGIPTFRSDALKNDGISSNSEM